MGLFRATCGVGAGVPGCCLFSRVGRSRLAAPWMRMMATIAAVPTVAMHRKARLRRRAVAAVSRPNADRALDKSGALRPLPFEERPRQRIYQFAFSRGVRGFPEHPADVLRDWPPETLAGA